jgi:hypothetical protein
LKNILSGGFFKPTAQKKKKSFKGGNFFPPPFFFFFFIKKKKFFLWWPQIFPPICFKKNVYNFFGVFPRGEYFVWKKISK